MARDSSNRPVVEERVAEFIARRESGEALTVQEFAARHPEIERELLRALGTLEAAEALLPDPGGDGPERVGPYRVLEQVGRGGTGRVFAVTDPDEPGGRLAIKLLNPVALLNPRNRKRFARETQVLKRLDHPGVVRVRDASPAGETPYLVMDLVDGPTLAELIEEARRAGGEPSPGASSVRGACALVRALAETVEVLHAAGVVHRDLKPGNVLLAPGGGPVIVDFGLAAVEAAASLTGTGDLVGTPHYMAPEQAFGRAVDARADVWALGAILYELLTLEPPHTGRDPVSVLESIKRTPIVPVRRRRPDVPRALARILERALAFRPARRTGSARALAEDLGAFLDGRAVRARPCWRGRWFDLRRAHPRAVAAGGLALVLAAAGGAGVQLARPRVDPRRELQQAMDRATMAYAAGDLQEASRVAEQILRLDPDEPTGHFLLLAEKQAWDSDDPAVEALIEGTVYRGQGKLREAEAAFRRAMRLAPASPLPVILMGRIAGEIDERASRVPELLESIALQPDSAALYVALGEGYLLQDQCAHAAEAFEHALRLDPEPAAAVRGQIVRARYCAAGIEPALDALDAAIEAVGSHQQVSATIEWLIKEKGHGAEVRARLRERVARRPDYPAANLQLALAHDFDEQLHEAAGWYEKTLTLDPDNRSALSCLMHLRSGANRDTCGRCRAAFAEHPDLYDPVRAEELGLRLLEVSRGRSLGLAMFVVDVGNRIGRLEAFERKLEEQHAHADSDEARAQIDKVLRKLRAHAAGAAGAADRSAGPGGEGG